MEYIIILSTIIFIILLSFIYHMKQYIDMLHKNNSVNERKLKHLSSKITSIKSYLQDMNYKLTLPPISFIGVGGGGCNILNHIASIDKRHNYILVDSDQQSLQNYQIFNKLHINNHNSLGCGHNTECGKKIITPEICKQILKATQKQHKIVFVATLGGGTGSGSIIEIIKFFTNVNKNFQIIVTLPFSFEGSKKMETSLQTIKELQSITNHIKILKNDTLLKIKNKKKDLSVSQYFYEISKLVYQNINPI